MKKAFFIIGPESSGTRMLTQAFIKVGAYGSGGHFQKLDKEGFNNGQEFIVFRRSIPHGKAMPLLSNVIQRLIKREYKVFPIVILRDKDACAASQVKNNHADNLAESRSSIEEAINHIYQELSSISFHPIIVHYEPFVNSPAVRKAFFTSLELKTPEMEFYDGNEQYKEKI